MGKNRVTPVQPLAEHQRGDIGLLDCDRYIGDIIIPLIPWTVKPGFCSIHYTVTLTGLKNVNRNIGNIVL